MIYGIGTDIVGIARIRGVLSRHGEHFARRILTPSEWEEYRQLPGHLSPQAPAFLAKRFAAKEAAAKALGTGFSNGITLESIAVVHDRQGCPGLEFFDAAARFCRRQNIERGLLSLSDEKDYALAFVTLLLKP